MEPTVPMRESKNMSKGVYLKPWARNAHSMFMGVKSEKRVHLGGHSEISPVPLRGCS